MSSSKEQPSKASPQVPQQASSTTKHQVRPVRSGARMSLKDNEVALAHVLIPA